MEPLSGEKGKNDGQPHSHICVRASIGVCARAGHADHLNVSVRVHDSTVWPLAKNRNVNEIIRTKTKQKKHGVDDDNGERREVSLFLFDFGYSVRAIARTFSAGLCVCVCAGRGQVCACLRERVCAIDLYGKSEANGFS